MEVADERLASGGHVFRALLLSLLLLLLILLQGSCPPDWKEAGEEDVVWTRRDLCAPLGLCSLSGCGVTKLTDPSPGRKGRRRRGIALTLKFINYDYPRDVKSNFFLRTRANFL